MRVIDELIDLNGDNTDLLIDAVGGILRVESDEQQKKAANVGKDSSKYNFHVFIDRDEPLSAKGDDLTPVVVVNLSKSKLNRFSNKTIDETVELEIDCYGFGVSSSDNEETKTADFNAIRSCRSLSFLVTKILTAEINYDVQLSSKDQVRGFKLIDKKFAGVKGLRGSSNVFCACRLTFECVVLNERVTNKGVELSSVNVKVGSRGEVFADLTYDYDKN